MHFLILAFIFLLHYCIITIWYLCILAFSHYCIIALFHSCTFECLPTCIFNSCIHATFNFSRTFQYALISVWVSWASSMWNVENVDIPEVLSTFYVLTSETYFGLLFCWKIQVYKKRKSSCNWHYTFFLEGGQNHIHKILDFVRHLVNACAIRPILSV